LCCIAVKKRVILKKSSRDWKRTREENPGFDFIEP